jgi:DNA-directed RNA polymerase specialized sigma24 family protein
MAPIGRGFFSGVPGNSAVVAARQVDEVERGLVRRLSSKDRAVYEPALSELLRRHGPAVLTFVEQRVADPSVVQSILEETFFTLAVRPQSFDDGRQSLRSYLIGEAHRRCDRALDGAEPERRNDDLLSAEERLAIDLARFGAMTYSDIAELLGWPPQTVLDHLSSALLRLSAGPEAGIDAEPPRTG